LNANLITDTVYSGNMSTGVESVVRRTYELGQHPETTHRRLTDSSATRSTSSPVYTIQPVVKPVVKPVVQPLWQPVVSCKRGISTAEPISRLRGIDTGHEIDSFPRNQ